MFKFLIISKITFKSLFSFYEKEQAFGSLKKWLRLNNRANVEDLLNALILINRRDIVKLIKRKIKSEKNKNFNLDGNLETDIDIQKREAEIIHKKLVKFFEKVKSGQVTIRKSYEYVSIGNIISNN